MGLKPCLDLKLSSREPEASGQNFVLELSSARLKNRLCAALTFASQYEYVISKEAFTSICWLYEYSRKERRSEGNLYFICLSHFLKGPTAPVMNSLAFSGMLTQEIICKIAEIQYIPFGHCLPISKLVLN